MKQFIFALFMSLSLSVFSQVTLRVQGGVEFAGMSANENYGVGDWVGYRGGVGVDIPLNGRWSLLTGVFAVKKVHGMSESRAWQGMHEDEPFDYALACTSRIVATYLHLPLKAQYNIPLRKHLSLMVNGGAYFAYGIGGRMSFSFFSQEMPESFGKNGWYPDIDRLSVAKSFGAYTFRSKVFNTFDAGLSAGADLRYRFVYIGFSGEYGLRSLTKDKLPKDFPSYLAGFDDRLVSPHNLSLEIHVGAILNLFSK
jgi:hypothetical protein